MTEQWQYQVRIALDDEPAALARSDPDNEALAELTAILNRHNAKLQCQYDAFAGYVAEAEREGAEEYPLYKWTKATIEDPDKKAKYVKSFTLYVDGDEVYDKTKADPLEAELKPLVGGGMVTGMSKFDTNPANSPQAPERYRD